MKIKRRLILFPVLFCLLLTVSTVPASSNTIKWKSYKKGIALGKKENKKIFINFYAQWCTYCTMMDAKTFKNSDVIAYLNKHFISIKVNMDKEKETAADYFVRGLPTSWFVSENGNKISGLPGYIKPDTFINILKFVHTDSYKKMTFIDFLNNI